MAEHWFCLLVLLIGTGPLTVFLVVGPRRVLRWLEKMDR